MGSCFGCFGGSCRRGLGVCGTSYRRRKPVRNRGKRRVLATRAKAPTDPEHVWDSTGYQYVGSMFLKRLRYHILQIDLNMILAITSALMFSFKSWRAWTETTRAAGWVQGGTGTALVAWISYLAVPIHGGVLLVAVLMVRALLFGGPDYWNLPFRQHLFQGHK